MEKSAPALSAQAGGSAISWIDRLCGRFERSGRNDERPRIEDYLAEVPPAHRQEALAQLLAIEIELRRSRGQEIDRAEYERRFPEDSTTIDHAWQGSSRVYLDTIPPEPGTTRNAACTATRYADLTIFRRGGLGALFRARDEELHRDVILKFIHEKYCAEPDALSQFRVEAEVTGRLDHPGVVPVYGIGQDWNGQPFYVMRMIHGRELRQAIQEYHEAGGPANRSRDHRQKLFSLLEHLASACNTVAYAHDVGIVHCDLKPANIMIGKYGETLVLDWGLATAFERTSTFFAANEPSIRPRSADSSQSGKHGGTIGYISPEQLSSNGCVAPTSDVYSLGATLYEILCGRPPFSSHDPDVVDQIRRGTFRRPREVNRHVPRRLEAIALKAMRLAPEDRYRTAKLLAADLKNWMRDDEVQAAPDNLMGRLSRLARRHRTVTIAIFIAMLFMTAAGTWAHQSRSHAVAEQHLRKLVESHFNTSLSTFEDLCQPLADGEMSNLRVFQPMTRKIQEFADDYLQNFADNDAMRPQTARIYALRATAARIGLQGDAKGVEDYQRAADLFQKLVDGSHEPEYVMRLAQVERSQGQLLLQRGELEPAREALEKSCEKLKRLFAARPDDQALKRSLAESYHSLGDVWLKLYRKNNQSEAETNAGDYLQLGRSLLEELVHATRGAERRDHQRGLARSFGYLGDLHITEGKAGQAREDYESSLALRKGLYHDDPNPENAFQYARGLANFGTLERDFGGHLESALDRLEEARGLQEQLVDQFGDVADFRIDLAITLNLLAELHLFATSDDATHADDHRRVAAEFAKRAEQNYGRVDSGSQAAATIADMALSVVLQSLAQQSVDPQASAAGALDAGKTISDRLGRDATLDANALFVQALARALSGDPRKLLDSWTALDESVDRGNNALARIDRHRTLGLRAFADSPEWGSKLQELLKRIHSRIVDE